MTKICYCTGTKEGLSDCTMCGDGCSGPVTSKDEEIRKKLLDDLLDTPGVSISPSNKTRWKQLILYALLDFRKTPVSLIKKKYKEIRK